MAAEEASGISAGQENGMANANGVSLLLVLGEPFSDDQKELILERITKNLRSFESQISGFDINAELQEIATAAPVWEDGLGGEKIVEYASENLRVTVLSNPQTQTFTSRLRTFLLNAALQRVLLYAGQVLQGCGSWIFQDDLLSFSTFNAIFKEADVQNALKQQGSSLDIHIVEEGEWTGPHIAKQNFSSILPIRVNPPEVIQEFSGILQFSAYLSYMIKVRSCKDLLQSSDVVGNIRFTRPTLYVFPGAQGDSALFGISGFNLLVNAGYNKKACFWGFTRHLDRIDAMLMTHLGTDNLFGVSSVFERKVLENVHPEIGYVYFNAIDKMKHSPNGDILPENGGSHKPASLVVNLVEQGNRLVENMKLTGHSPHNCLGHIAGNELQPLNLYHKVGHGTLDMYVLNPTADSKELKDFLAQWSKNVNNFTSTKNGIPLPSQVSIAALLVWRPSSPSEKITRILFTGNAPQDKIFAGLDKLKSQEIFKHASCSETSLHAPKAKKPAPGGTKSAKGTANTRASPIPRGSPVPHAKTEARRPTADKKPPIPSHTRAAPAASKPAKDAKNKRTTGASKEDKGKKTPSTPSSASKGRSPVDTPHSTPVDQPVAAAEVAASLQSHAESDPTPKEPEPAPKEQEPAPKDQEPEPTPKELESAYIDPEPELISVAAPTELEPESTPKEPEPVDAEPEPEPIPVVAPTEPEPESPKIPEPVDIEPEPAQQEPEPVRSESEPEDDPAAVTPEDVKPVVDEALTGDLLGDFSAPVQEPASPLAEPLQDSSLDEQDLSPEEDTAPVASPCLKSPEQFMDMSPQDEEPQSVPEPEMPSPAQPLSPIDPAPVADPSFKCPDQFMEMPPQESSVDAFPEEPQSVPEPEMPSPAHPLSPIDPAPVDALFKGQDQFMEMPPQESSVDAFPEEPQSVPEPEMPSPTSPIEPAPVAAPCFKGPDQFMEMPPQEGLDSEPVETLPTYEAALDPEFGSDNVQEPSPTQELPPKTEGTPNGFHADIAEMGEVSQASTDDTATVQSGDAGLGSPEALPDPHQFDAATFEAVAMQSSIGEDRAEEVFASPKSTKEEATNLLPEAEQPLPDEPSDTEQNLLKVEQESEKVSISSEEDQELPSPEETMAEGQFLREEARHEPPRSETPEMEDVAPVSSVDEASSLTEEQARKQSLADFGIYEDDAALVEELQAADSKTLEELGLFDKPEAQQAPVLEEEPKEPSEPPAEPDHDESGELDDDSLMDVRAGTERQLDSLEDVSAPAAEQTEAEASTEAPVEHQINGNSNPFDIMDSSKEYTGDSFTNPFVGMGLNTSSQPNPFDIPDPATSYPDIGSQDPLPSFPEVQHLRKEGEVADRDSLEREDAGDEFDPLKEWGQPMGLPAPNGPAAKGESPRKADATKKAPTRTGAKPTAGPKKSPDAKPPEDKKATRKPASAPPATKTTRKAALEKGAEDSTKKPSPRDGPAKKTASAPAARKTTAAKPSPSKPESKAAPTPTKTATAAKRTTGSAGPKAPATSAATRAPAPVKLTPVTPFYVDLTYIPGHGDSHYVDLDFFRKVRARYYVLSSLNPSAALLNSLLEAKKTWDDPGLEVTVIPTYDTDTLRHWMALNRDQLTDQKIDFAPSASRCTIQLQDHEASCAAYRLEF